MDTIEETRKLDVGKCFAEIGQLQSQQFWLTSFAISVFGVFLSSIAKDFFTNPEKSIEPYIFGSFALYCILYLLFHWFLQMRWQIAFVSVWAEMEGESIWERDANEFSELWKNKKKISSTRFASYIFLALGLLWPGLFALAIWTAGKLSFVKPWEWITIVLLCLIYGGLATWRGIYRPTRHREELRKQWEAVIKSRKEAVAQNVEEK